MIEPDLAIDLEAVGGLEPGTFAVSRDAHRLQHLDAASRPALVDHAGALDQKHERLGTAVHDRQLGSADLDQEVVDLADRERRHQVLDGRDHGAAGLAERGAHRGVADLIEARVQGPAAGAVVAHEADAAVGFGRMQAEGDPGAGVEAGADATDRVAERPL